MISMIYVVVNINKY
jgi:hypothetical protein